MIFITIAQLGLVFWVVIYLTMNMIYLVRLYPDKDRSVLYPYLSVCIPARNEERDIKSCLESLLNQDYPAFEVIVVDDNSSDRTASIICSMQSQYPNLVFISGEALAPGWLGKPYALYQACQVSRGDYLLFTDADLVYQRYALKTAMNKVIDEKLDLLTLMPAAIFVSFWERAIQPVIFGFIAALTSFRKVNSSASQSAMGFGAFLLFKKESYQQIGGHVSVQNEILEDVMIAKISKLNGLNMLVADGKLLFSIRMYHSIKEIWVGWRKNIFLAMKGSITKTIFYAAVILCFVLTPYITVAGNFWVGTGVAWTCVSLIGLILCLMTGCGLCHQLGLKKYNIFLFPIGAIAMVMIMFNSMVQVVFFGRSEWRGRIYKQ
jgi:chlorobactene glucosyltransferase